MPPKTVEDAASYANYMNTNAERERQMQEALSYEQMGSQTGEVGGFVSGNIASPSASGTYTDNNGMQYIAAQSTPEQHAAVKQSNENISYAQNPYGFSDQLGAAKAAARTSAAGWDARQNFYGGFQQDARSDMANLRAGVYGGQFRTPEQFTNVQQFQRGAGPQYQDSGASSMYNTEYIPQQGGPQFQDYNIGQGPGQFQQGYSPEIQRFQQGNAPHQQMFQAGQSPIGSQFQRQQGPQLQQFQRGPDAQFTGANQGQFQFDHQSSPAYQHRLNEGMNAIQGSAAARGSLKSGQTLKDLTRFAQGEASQDFAQDYARQRGAFESDRAMGEREAGRRTGFDVGQQQFGQGLDFQAQDRFQGRQQQADQWGQGMDFQAQEAQAGRGMQGHRFDTGTGQQALRDYQQGNRQDYQFGQNLGFQADQAYQGANMDRFRGDQAMGFNVNRAGAQDWQTAAGLQAQRANMANQFGLQGAQMGQSDRQFGANLNQQGVQDYRNLLSREGQQRNLYNQDNYQFGTGVDQASVNDFNRANLAANAQNYGQMNQQRMQSYGMHQGLADRGTDMVNIYGQGISQAADAEANAMLGIGNVYGANAARRSQERANSQSNLFNLFGSALQGGAMVGGAMLASDRRLKRNISKLGKFKEYTKYLYQYNWSDDWFIGVMSDEVRKIKPEAVKVDEQGFDMVNYGVL